MASSTLFRRRGLGASFSLVLRRCFASTPDYFAVLSCERRFDIDADALRRTYLERMTERHPDKLAARSVRDTDANAGPDAALLTEACAVLTDPVTRAKHLLELRGRPVDGAALDEAFFQRIISVREAVDAAAGDERVLADIRAENSRALGEASRDLARAFANDDLDEAARLTAVVQYLSRTEEAVDGATGDDPNEASAL